MNPLHQVGDVFDALDATRAGAPAFCTNFFPVEESRRQWIARGELRAAQAGGAACFLRKERDFSRFYFAAPDAKSLELATCALDALKCEPVVTDVVMVNARIPG